MSRVPLDVLPFDICDRVLTFLPDLYSLQSAVLSSKHVYDAYLPRMRSILRTVADNEVGPALPCAIALVRTMRKLGQEPLQKILEGLNNPDADSPVWTTDILGREARKLSHVAAVVRRLETYFCVLHKDRTTPVSILSEAERHRFHRAIYRIWIIAVLANDSHKKSIRDSPDTAFLKSMSEQELVEVYEGMKFLKAVHHLSLFRDPTFFDSGTYSPYLLQLDSLLAGFDGAPHTQTTGGQISASGIALIDAYLSLEYERQIKSLYESKYDSAAILENSRIEDVQICQKCGIPTSSLFGENNWHLLNVRLGLRDFLACLPGKLFYNDYLRSDLAYLVSRHASFVSIMNDMFNSQNDPESGWVKSDWLCVECIKAFWKERAFSWIVNELVENGHQFKENCWYGWNCRTQTHTLEHAKKLNHLCEPTDRDDTNKINYNLPVIVGDADTDSDSEWEAEPGDEI